jgi:hypothetical protein
MGGQQTINRAHRKMTRAEDQAQTAKAAYERANAAYQQALRAATGPGGGYNPRSPEALHAEDLRVQMLAARRARDFAHSAWMAAQIEWQRANGWWQ